MFRFFPQKERYTQHKDLFEFDETREVPKHLAIIMDGNGRWAQNRRLPRVAGHKEGMNTVKKMTKIASRLGVKVLTLYAFSTENWKRPNDEVNYLMQLPVDFFNTFVPELVKENIKVTVMGYLEALPQHTKKAVDDAIEATKNNTGMILNFALNYGSRAEMLTGMQKIAKEVEKGTLKAEEISEEIFSKSLMTGMLPINLQDPELVIRTSGEERISNFLLWQIAYSELYFTPVFWPDFDELELRKALGDYQHRQRRFGGLKEEEDK